MGCAGRVANGISTVHLSYLREKTGHAQTAVLAAPGHWSRRRLCPLPPGAERDIAGRMNAGYSARLAYRRAGIPGL